MAGNPPIAAAHADPTFVGRGETLDVFTATLGQALAGRRQVLTVSGEPGIGKTRCAEAFAQVAEDQGALVLWGRCYEEPGAPPYWPWVQVLRNFINASSPSEVQLAMGRGVAEIASLVPEVAGGTVASPTSRSLDFQPSQMRFQIFDAISQFFARATQQVPVVVMLDNLHWADAPSLSLLEFLSGELQRSRLLFVGTYRDNEVSRKSPLLRMLGGLGQDAGVQRLRLGGLSESAIAALAGRLLGSALPPTAVAAIHQQTDGNPLFVIELIKVLIDEGQDAGIEPIAMRIPDGIREAIGRRLARLSESANELLATASVIGRMFSATEVAAVAERNIDGVLKDLAAATQAGMVELCEDSRADYRFTHALIRETLYDEISTLDRLRLHGRVANTLVATHASDLEPALSRIAHHYYETAAIGSLDQAVEYAMRAADYALRIHAYEETLVHCDQLISLLSPNGRTSNDERLVRVLFLKGQTLLSLGTVQPAIQSLFEATSVVSRLGNAELLVDIASQLVLATSHTPQRHAIPLLEKALALLPEGDSIAGAKVRAALAFALRTMGRWDCVDRLVREAVEMGERLADDRTRTYCLLMAILALRGRPETLDWRIDLGEQFLELAQRREKLDLAQALSWQVLHLLEQGRIDEAAAFNEQLYAISVDKYLLHEYYAAATRIALALLRGDWKLDLEPQIEALLVRGGKTRPEDAEGVYGAQMFMLNRDRGRLASLAPVVRAFAESRAERAWKPGLMLMCAEVGLLDQARSLFEQFASRRFAQLARDDMFVANLVYCAETCCVLGDRAHAEVLYGLLLPYAEQTANHPRALCFGSARLFLARLASTAGDAAAAHAHFEAALQRNRAMAAWPFVARTLYHYGAFVFESDVEQGRALLTEGEQVGARLGMTALCGDIDGLLRGQTGPNAFPDGLTVREVDVLRLIAIGRSNKDVAAVLAISLNTVATHVRSILNKTGCANRTEAAAYASRHNLVERPPSATKHFNRASSDD